jgi:biotin carboxyl carrier protein
MYLATVNQQAFEIALNSTEILVDNQPFTADFCTIDAQNIHIIHENKGYNVEIISQTADAVALKINGTTYTVAVQNELQQLLQKMGINNLKTAKINELRSPMPGLVLKILVDVGTQVQKGDPLVVLESMKMENILKAAGEGTVATIACKQGNTVDKGAILIGFAQ